MSPPLRLLLRPLLRPLPRLTSTPLTSRISRPSRPYSASTALTPLLTLTHELLTLLHSTGLPWSYTLPLAALLLRILTTLSLSLPARLYLQRRISLNPLLTAFTPHAGTHTHVRHYWLQRIGRSLRNQYYTATTERRLFTKIRARRWGATTLPPALLGLAQIPIFLLVMETLRAMLGSQNGLLAGVVNWLGKAFGDAAWVQGLTIEHITRSIVAAPGRFVGWIWGTKAPAAAPDASISATDLAAPTASISPDAIPAPLEAPLEVPTTDALFAAAATPPTPTAFSPTWFDTTLMTEGPPWALDLTLPDPSFITPALLSITMVLAALNSSRAGGPLTAAIARRQRITRNALVLVGALMGPVMANVPAGLVYYWVWSMGFGVLGQRLLDGWVSVGTPVVPLKRPVRKKVTVLH